MEKEFINEVTEEQKKKVKGLGFLFDKTTKNCFNARVITRNGKITAKEAEIIANASKLYGNGEIAFTTRLTIEIQKVPYENIELLISYLEKNGLETGGTGPKVRPVVSCKGTTCHFGLIDTFKLSEEIHNRFYKGYHDVILPHKFKIAVGGCPNNCVKPDLNDIGIIGQKVIELDLGLCKGCKSCIVEKGCPMKAITLENNKVNIDKNICNNCGRCLNKCPFKVFDNYYTGYSMYIGGRWGKKASRAVKLDYIFTNEKDILKATENTICFFRDKGITGERFADTIERIGFDNVQSKILKGIK